MGPLYRGLALAVLLAGCATSGSSARPSEARTEAPPSYMDGRDLYDQGMYVEAADEFEAATREAPDYAASYLWFGTCHLRMASMRERPFSIEEHAERAAYALTQAIRLNPQDKRPFRNRALAYVHLRRFYDAAADLLHIVTVLDPRDGDSHLMLAQIYDEKYEGMEVRALEHYERYLSLGGNDEGVRRRVERLRSLVGAGILPPGPTTAPTPTTGPRDRESEAQHLALDVIRAGEEGRLQEMVGLADQLLRDYEDTNFVRENRDAIQEDLQRYLQGEQP